MDQKQATTLTTNERLATTGQRREVKQWPNKQRYVVREVAGEQSTSTAGRGTVHYGEDGYGWDIEKNCIDSAKGTLSDKTMTVAARHTLRANN